MGWSRAARRRAGQERTGWVGPAGRKWRLWRRTGSEAVLQKCDGVAEVERLVVIDVSSLLAREGCARACEKVLQQEHSIWNRSDAAVAINHWVY